MTMSRNTTLLIPARQESESLTRLIPLLWIASESVKEIIIVVDSHEDSTLEMRQNPDLDFKNVKFIVSGEIGIAAALQAGVQSSTSEFIIICMADEILPIFEIEKFIDKLVSGASLVSATRYTRGGKRYGGSWLSHVTSRLANWVLFRLLRWPISDATSGMKAFRRSDWETLSSNIMYGGWAPALALARNAKKANLVIEEVPVISVDRLIGGTSSFRFWHWIQQYVFALIGKNFS